MNCVFETTKEGDQWRHVCSVCQTARVANRPRLVRACSGQNPKPAPISIIGKCHICTAQKPIAFCPFCNHWMCRECRKSWAARGLAALKVWLGGKQAGCCGPKPPS